METPATSDSYFKIMSTKHEQVNDDVLRQCALNADETTLIISIKQAILLLKFLFFFLYNLTQPVFSNISYLNRYEFLCLSLIAPKLFLNPS